MSQNIPPELQVLRFPLKLLKLIDLWGDRRYSWRYFVLLSSMLVGFIIPKLVFGSGEPGFDSFARSTAELIFFFEVCISIGIFAARRGSFEKLVAILRRTVEQHNTGECIDEIRMFNGRMDKFSRRYITWIAFCAAGYVALPITTTCVNAILAREGEQKDFVLLVEMQFYWMDIRRNPVHYVIYVLLILVPVASSAFQSALKGGVILIVIQYGTKLFDLVGIRLKSLMKMKSDSERANALGEIVELHKLALEYTAYLEDIVCFVMMNQILNCILIWCLMMFYLSSNFGPNAVCLIILFTVLMGEMVVYCWNGTNLTQKAAAVGHAVYHHPWYNESSAVQKNIRLIIQRAQKPTGITAAKFYFVNIERLGLVVQASYSYYLMLKRQF